MDKKNYQWWSIVIIGLVFCAAVLGFLLKTDIEKRAYKSHLDRGLPRINIELGEVSLEEIKNGSKETKYEGNRLALYSNGYTNEYENVEVKGRGNTTWEQPKKPYQIKFQTKTNLLGLGAVRKWTLLANYFDHSYLRDDVAFKLAEMIGVKYNNRGKFVELYFNDEYEGLYYLVQKVELVKGSVDLKSDDGILVENDTLHKNSENCYFSVLNDCLILKDAIRNEPEEQELLMNEFLKNYRVAEVAAKKGDFDGVAEILDIESFAKYYLVNEFTVNPDAYMSSFYLYRSDGGKISAGPVWDFDYALANHEWIWQEDDSFFLPNEDEKNMNTKIMKYLTTMPEFRSEAQRIFTEEMRGRKDEFILAIQTVKKEIEKAALVDSEKWGITNYEDDTKALLDWINDRYDYFEQKYGNGIKDNNGRKRARFL